MFDGRSRTTTGLSPESDFWPESFTKVYRSPTFRVKGIDGQLKGVDSVRGFIWVSTLDRGKSATEYLRVTAMTQMVDHQGETIQDRLNAKVLKMADRSVTVTAQKHELDAEDRKTALSLQQDLAALKVEREGAYRELLYLKAIHAGGSIGRVRVRESCKTRP